MSKLIVNGGNKIYGSVNISGSKNSALPIICASLLTEETTLYNIPQIKDIELLLDIFAQFQVSTIFRKDKLIVNTENMKYIVLDIPLINKFRASYYLISIFLYKYGKCVILRPGGCKIGDRKIDLHLMSFLFLGYKWEEKDGLIILEKNRKVHNAFIEFPKKSVGATINTLLLSSFNNQMVTIKNVAFEPEIIDVITFLSKLGANIDLNKDSIIVNNSTNCLKKPKYKIIPDRIEAATYVIMALLCGNLEIKKINYKHILNFITPLIKAGANIEVYKDSLQVCKSSVNGMNIEVGEYPMFSTDYQPIIVPILCYAKGESIIKENIFENRFNYVDELNKFGKTITKVSNRQIIINKYNKKFDSAIVFAQDLRGAASLLLMSLSINGTTIIKDIDFIERGYSNIYEKVKNVGGKIRLDKTK